MHSATIHSHIAISYILIPYCSIQRSLVFNMLLIAVCGLALRALQDKGNGKKAVAKGKAKSTARDDDDEVSVHIPSHA